MSWNALSQLLGLAETKHSPRLRTLDRLHTGRFLVTAVYILTPIFDDPRFASLDFDLDPSLIGNEYLYEDFDGRNLGD